ASNAATTGNTAATWTSSATLPDWAAQINGTYTVQAAATDKDGNTFTGSAVSFTLQNTPPAISSVTGPANGTYGVGQSLNFAVTFSGNVTVNTSGGTPTIGLTIGSTTRGASYVSGSGTTTLVFRYTVVSGDNDSDGIASASPITLNG